MNWLTKLMKPLIRGAAELSPSCREATRLQSEALDRQLGLRQRIGLHIHLFLCKWCRRYGKQIGFLRSIARQPKNHEASLPSQSLRSESRERIRRRVLEEGEKLGRRDL
jgi:hypothetical protein